MSIRFKLLLSNILMVVIPLISAIVLAVILIGLSFDNAELKYPRPGEEFEKIAQDIFREFITISNDALNNSDKFKDKEYLRDIDGRLKALNSGIGILIDNKIYYLSDKIDRQEFEQQVDAAIRSEKPNERAGFSHNDGIQSFNHDFKFSDGENFTLYVFLNTSPIKGFIGGLVHDFMSWFLIIILVTNGVLTFIVSQSIIKPLKKLKLGAEEIKNGNLSFSINEKSRDEVGDVCRAFEEMRQRLKDAINQQLKYDEERNEFIASITHDLKTPLTLIKGHIDGMRDGVADTPQKREKYMDIIHKKVIDMDRLINDLTFYSNQTLKKVPFNFSKVNLKIFIEDMIDEYRMELEKLGISIECINNLEDNIFVKADVEKLKRVVANIFENSIKYMDKENGYIKIELRDENNKVLIGIHDNGEGIKKEYLPNIFTRFYRGDASRNTAKGGSGLGLAIASQIITEHGGRIFAESELGKGTSIYFELEKIGEDNEKTDSNN